MAITAEPIDTSTLGPIRSAPSEIRFPASGAIEINSPHRLHVELPANVPRPVCVVISGVEYFERPAPSEGLGK